MLLALGAREDFSQHVSGLYRAYQGTRDQVVEVFDDLGQSPGTRTHLAPAILGEFPVGVAASVDEGMSRLFGFCVTDDQHQSVHSLIALERLSMDVMGREQLVPRHT